MTGRLRLETRRRVSPGRVVVLIASLALAPFATGTARADGPDGEAIFQQTCAACHGAEGQGADDYPEPLVGKRPLDNLTKYIAKTMPADDPGTLSEEQAGAVASYIFDAFYAPEAQARNAPPRVELARLTVRQYRNAVADLIGTFRQAPERADEHGLRGSYYQSRNPGGGRRGRNRGGGGSGAALERIDPVVAFDFGTESPDKEKIEDPHQFSMRWEGSVFAPDSGQYTFTIRTDHAARLWVNDLDRPLVDAWVMSGDDLEHRETIHLLGGRWYPVRLEFSKAKQGVDDSKKEKEQPPKPAQIALEWTPPGRVAEPIPARDLSPARSPTLFVLEAPFPPDDRSVGYERGTTVSKAWDEATTEAAIETAGYVVAHLNELADTKDDANDRVEKLKAFSRRFAERAFRRPLTDELAALYVDRQFDDAPNPETAVKRVVMLTLKSPRFLYLDTDEELDPFDVATRISLALWDSLPDQDLLDAAASGLLATREQVAQQAQRMVDDPRTRSKVRAFLLQWLKMDPAPDLAKSEERFPNFDEALASDLRTSLDLFLEDVVWGESSDFRRLLLAEELPLNGRLATFYGLEGVDEKAGFEPRRLDEGKRSGLVTHPYLLAGFSYTETTSPIHRGVFLLRGVLGRPLSPPPAAFSPLAPDLHPDLTTRERVALQTSPESCAKCHEKINPLGFALESFDAVGRYRDREKDKPIDDSGTYQAAAGETVNFRGARELAEFLAGSEEVHGSFVRQLFQYLVKQPIRAYGPETPDRLRNAFEAQGFNVRSLLVGIVAETALEPCEAASGSR